MSIIPLSKRIGIIGGGQLGKMMVLEGKKMGLYIVALDPCSNCPASSVVDELLIGDFNDDDKILELSKKVDVITYEFEHIGTEALAKLESCGYEVYPSIKSLRIIQNKYYQKLALKNASIPVPDFKEVKTLEDINLISELFEFPMMLKTCTGGYDGKGNYLIRCKEEIASAFESLGSGKLPLMVERFINFEKEVSVLACRGIDGTIVVYPVGENLHKNNILFETQVPANISDHDTKQALHLAKRVMEVFKGVGMFCVEMFVCSHGVFINEIAPRPHNSGHYTIEACITSQFMNHIRAIIGLPLGSTTLYTPVIMRNLLGEDDFNGNAIATCTAEALSINGVSLHLYGKEKTSPNRKMGHFTVIGDDIEICKQKADKVQQLVKIISI